MRKDASNNEICLWEEGFISEINSQSLGKHTLAVEVNNISSHGIWLITGERELFISYDKFPWFKDVPIGKILNVEEPSPGHFF